jgi:hypothetical protein
MDIEVEFAFDVVRAELAETVVRLSVWAYQYLTVDFTYCASSHVTIGDRPMFHIRVKNEIAVKMIGAHKNSYSSSTSRIPPCCTAGWING